MEEEEKKKGRGRKETFDKNLDFLKIFIKFP